MRVVANVLITLIGLFVLFLTVGFAFGIRASNHEGWWVGLPIGLPPTWTLLGLAWAMWTGRRARPITGLLTALGALEYAAFFAYATFAISREVARSTGLLAGIAYLALFPLWGLVVLFTVLAWVLLRGQGVRRARFVFLVVALAWLAAWLGFWGIWLSRPGTDGLLAPRFWVIHGFFLLPALFTLTLGQALGRRNG